MLWSAKNNGRTNYWHLKLKSFIFTPIIKLLGATCPPALPLLAALFIVLVNYVWYREQDVAAIDVNMGCPKDYSIKVYT